LSLGGERPAAQVEGAGWPPLPGSAARGHDPPPGSLLAYMTPQGDLSCYLLDELHAVAVRVIDVDDPHLTRNLEHRSDLETLGA
jgi:hypothetical protein